MPRHASSGQNTFLDTIATRFDGIHSNFVLGNAQAHGHPIVYCSDGFCELTGFSRAQVMAKGCGCRFLYGPETSESETCKIKGALEEKKELKTELRFYRKNGTPFWCLLDIVPIKNEKRDVVLFLVSHKDISKEKAGKDGDKHSPGSPSKNSGDGSSDDEDKSDDDDDDEGMPENYNYGRRRSRAVLYHISGQLNKQNKAKSKLQQLNRVSMIASQMPEYKVQEVKKSMFIIVHYGIFKIGWDWLILLCTFYIAIMVPFSATFRKQGRFKDFMYVDAGVEVLFAIDIFLNFRTTFLNKSGQVVYESREIAVNYIRGWFLLDLLAAIPFDVLYAFSVETATMVHLLKLARLLRLARLLQKIERYNQYSVVVLAMLMCFFALLAHWLACVWYAIGKAELDASHDNWTVGWLYELSERLDRVIYNKSENMPDITTSYLTALYFTCSSLTSVGFGNVSANTNMEKVFSVCAMLVGAIMHAVVFGNVTTIIQRMYARRATFHSKTKDLKDFFRIHHFPKQLKHRMRDYFQAMWSINNGIDVREILKDFPEDMRGEIGLHLYREILTLPIFQEAPTGCLKAAALHTERFVCGPGEFIMRKGDAVSYLYYVCSGSLEVLKDEQVVAILGKGDIFGTDLDYDDPVSISGCEVRSLAYCELLCVQVKGLVDSLLMYPDFGETFSTELPNDLTYNVREGHEDHSDDESSTAAPVMTLPSISEDEEEEDNDKKVTEEKLFRKPSLKEEDEEDEAAEGRAPTSLSPLLSHFSRGETHMSSTDWLASRGRLPNGHIAATAISMRLGKHQQKIKQWINRARKSREENQSTPATPSSTAPPSVPGTPTTPHVTQRAKASPSGQALTALALRRSSAGMPRLIHRRSREKLKPCRTLPTLNTVTTERSVEQVMVHTLQMELEGTRDTVIGLERRLDDLHDDLASISRNVDSLLRLVSQSPAPPMYLSSHSLQPSYGASPSPHHHNLYSAPGFYFSQSSDAGDTRDTSSLHSALVSPAPDPQGGWSINCPPRSGSADHYLTPFRTAQVPPSPLTSPRINASPMGVHRNDDSNNNNSSSNNNNNNSSIASRISTDNTSNIDRLSDSIGSDSPHLHKPGARPFKPFDHNVTSADPKGSPIPGGRRTSPRPSNLSPLAAHRTRTLLSKQSRSLADFGPRPAQGGRSGGLDFKTPFSAASSPMTMSPLAVDKSAQNFQGDYYTLTQLDPCDAGTGHCDKADAMKRYNLDMTFSSSSPSPSPGVVSPESPMKFRDRKQSSSSRTSPKQISPSARSQSNTSLSKPSSSKESLKVQTSPNVIGKLSPNGDVNIPLSFPTNDAATNELDPLHGVAGKSPVDHESDNAFTSNQDLLQGIKFIDAESPQDEKGLRDLSQSHLPLCPDLQTSPDSPSPAPSAPLTLPMSSTQRAKSADDVTSDSAGLGYMFAPLSRPESVSDLEQSTQV